MVVDGFLANMFCSVAVLTKKFLLLAVYPEPGNTGKSENIAEQQIFFGETVQNNCILQVLA